MQNYDTVVVGGAACAMSASSASVYLILPILIGGMVDTLGMSETESGLTVSLFFVAYGLSSALGYFWIGTLPARTLALMGHAFLALGMFAAAFSDSAPAVATSLFVAGAGAGALLSLGIALIARMHRANQVFGLQMVAEQLLPAFMLILLPLLLPGGDFRSTCLFAAAVYVVIGVACLITPGFRVTTENPSAAQGEGSGRTWRTMLAVGLFFAGLSGVWSFTERLAHSQELSAEQINGILASALLGGALGGVLTATLVERYGRLRLQWTSAVVMGICLVMYALDFQLIQFALTTFLFLLAWNIVTPCQQALIAELDRPGRLVVIIPAAFALGVALGPALAGYMVESHGFPAMLLVCGGISALALLPLLRTEAALRRGAL